MEGASDTETDDDATTQDNRADDVSSPHLLQLFAVFVNSRRAEGQLHANAVPRSQPVASSSQSQSTICPVCLAVICDSAIFPCGHSVTKAG